MTATDELRRLLDERRVECRQTEWIDGITVKWRGSDGSEYGARNGLSFDGPTGGLVLYDLTPAQAVEATLGSDLQAENAELRELVRELLTDPDAWDYDYFKRRMRELGIGVDA